MHMTSPGNPSTGPVVVHRHQNGEACNQEPPCASAAILTELAAEVHTHADASAKHRDVLEEELRSSFLRMGIPDAMSAMLDDAEDHARYGEKPDRGADNFSSLVES